jgi:hypothetical protein
MKPNLQEWNFAYICVCEALLGAISGNIRMVSLNRHMENWVLKFWLNNEIAADREQIKEVKFYFENSMSDINSLLSIVVTEDEIPFPEPPERVVFKRREYY